VFDPTEFTRDDDKCVHQVRASLFAYDYEAMRLQMLPLRRELLAVVMHPSRLSKLGLYDDDAPTP
jgi:hypothetical protein